MLVEYIRLSLSDREQQDAFEDRPQGGGRYTRETWLRAVFAREHEFTHRGNEIVYEPDKDLTDDRLIVGRIGRERVVKDNAPPDEGLKERTHPEWQASIVVIDPTHHGDGQKITMQVRDEIGKCVPVLQSLASHLNTDPHGPFHIAAYGVVDPNTFWDFVTTNSGDVVSVTFEAVPPNMFGTKTTFANELRELKKNENAEKVKIELRNEGGLNPDTNRMREAVEYTLTQSGGTIKARTSKKKTYNSRNKTKRERLSEPPNPEKAAEHLVQQLRNAVGLAPDK